MSVSKLLATPGPFEYKGVTYLVSPWVLDIQGAFEKFFQRKAYENLRSSYSMMAEGEYERERAALRRDIDKGDYDFGAELIQAALDHPKNQKELVFLSLCYANKKNKELVISKELVEEIYESPEDKDRLLEVIKEVNSDPNRKRSTSSKEDSGTLVEEQNS